MVTSVPVDLIVKQLVINLQLAQLELISQNTTRTALSDCLAFTPSKYCRMLRETVYKIMDAFYWSSLPGLEKKIKWPVKIVTWSDSKAQVYSKADNAYFDVKRAQLIPFIHGQTQYDEIKNKSIVALKKKPKTLDAFLADIQWVLGCGRFQDQSRHGEEGGQRRTDEFYIPERRDWADRQDRRGEVDRREERRDVSMEDNRDRDASRDDRRTQTDEKRDEKREDHEKKDEVVKDDARKDQETSESDKKESRKTDTTDDRKKDRRDDDRKDRGRDRSRDKERGKYKERTDSKSKNAESESKKDESTDLDRDRSRKRRASKEGSRSPSVKKPRDNSPALSSHSKRSARDVEKEGDKDKDADEKSMGKDATWLLGTMQTLDIIEQNFSDWSDDSDDILNQPGEPSPVPPKPVETSVVKESSLAPPTVSAIQKPKPKYDSDFGSEYEGDVDLDSGSEFILSADEDCSSDESSVILEFPVSEKIRTSTSLEDVEKVPESSSSDQSDSEFPELKERNQSLTEKDTIGSNIERNCKQSDVKETCIDHPTVKVRKESAVNEDEIERDINSPKIYVRKVLTSAVSKFGKVKKHGTVWNQAHSCKYCHKVVTNISKHLKKHTKLEAELKEIEKLGKSLGKRHKTVRGKWDKIRNLGDHENNLKVIEEGKGEMILGRRQVDIFDISKYGPCPSCFVWIKLDKTLFRHQSLCPGNTSTEFLSGKELRIASLLEAGRLNVNASEALKSEVFTIMTYDDIGEVALHDNLIICLGNMWMTKNVGNKLKRRYYTSSRMRDTARLLMNMRNETGHTDYSMVDFLVPEHFDNVVTAALQTASPNFDDIEDLKAPSTAIKLGYDVKRMVTAKMGIAIRNRDAEDKKKCADFLKLMVMEWSLKVTRTAHVILQVRRFNKDKPLPDPRDIEMLAKYLRKEIEKIESLLSEHSKPALFRRALMLAETRLLIYNKRRAGEIEGISVKHYLRRTKGVTEMDKAMRSDLTELEQKLLESQEVLETRGKYGRGVPVIIPKDTVKLLGLIANGAVRRDGGVNENNKYLFANSVMGVLRSYDSLKTLCGEIKLRKPEQITSVNLRKFTATISQVFDLSPQEQSWLVNHLGHSMDIHKIHYRQTSAIIERVDITKMMLLQEYNLCAKYAGKKLSEIDLNEMTVTSDGKIELNVEEELIEDAPVAGPEFSSVMDTDGYTPGNNNIDEPDIFTFEDEEVQSHKQKKSSTSKTRVSWTKEELLEVHKYFSEIIGAEKNPGMKECQMAQEKSKENGGFIHKRNWETLKKKVWNIIQKKKRC